MQKLPSKKPTYLGQVFSDIGPLAIFAGLVLLVLGLIAFLKYDLVYDFGGWWSLGDGLLIGGIGLVILLISFLVPLFSKEKRAARRVDDSVYPTEADAVKDLATAEYGDKWRAAKDYISRNHPHLAGSGYWSAVRTHYLAQGGLWKYQLK